VVNIAITFGIRAGVDGAEELPAQDHSGMTASTRIRRIAVALAGLGALALSATGAALAEDNQSWIPFARNAGADQPFDQSFAKQWEANPPKGFPTLSPENGKALAAAIKLYAAIVEKGGWRVVPDGTLQLGSSGEPVAILRERLVLSGDLRSEEASTTFDVFEAGMERGVKRFQASNGLTPTGIVDKRTLAALNVPASARLKQLRNNVARLQEFSRLKDKRYVMVNIPAAQIEAVEGDRIVSRHAGVVGKVDRPTPLLKSEIHELNFNPVWHLPPTVIEKDLIPKGADMAKRGQDVLSKFKIDAYGGDGRKLDSTKINWSSGGARGLTYRQQPGPENPLGFVKINFHNSHSVYMHDTPSQTLFGRNFRAASSGCVRISGIEHLAGWLMAEQGWTNERVAAMKKSGERLDVRLKKPVPLYFVYITAWATEDGVIQFRRDLYNKDGLGALAAAY
jgi:L,D-transpeptidase YcbB